MHLSYMISCLQVSQREVELMPGDSPSRCSKTLQESSAFCLSPHHTKEKCVNVNEILSELEVAIYFSGFHN